MKKRMVCISALICLVLTLAACGSKTGKSTAGNYTDEMKIESKADISPLDGADSVEREGDHKDSPYFSRLDFFNMTSTDTLTILPKFKTLQQSSEWSCGVTAALMVLEHYDALADYNEKTLAELRPNGLDPEATTRKQALSIFEKVGGFEVQSSLDYGENIQEKFTLETIRNYLKDGVPVMIAWNDWGGHWQVIIGYDTMGTETEQDDVIIVADSYDTTDHNQDGYGIYSAERFYYNFTMYDFFDEKEGNDMLFIAAKPI